MVRSVGNKHQVPLPPHNPDYIPTRGSDLGSGFPDYLSYTREIQTGCAVHIAERGWGIVVRSFPKVSEYDVEFADNDDRTCAEYQISEDYANV